MTAWSKIRALKISLDPVPADALPLSCFLLAKLSTRVKSIFISLQLPSSRLHANTSFGPFSPAGQGRSACTLQKPESGDARTNPSIDEEPAVASGTQCVTANALSASTTAWTAFPFRLIFRPHLHTAHRKISTHRCPDPAFVAALAMERTNLSFSRMSCCCAVLACTGSWPASMPSVRRD